MTDSITRLFDEFDGGGISRRQLLHALAMAAVAIPAASFGQGTPARGATPGDSGRAGRGGGGRGNVPRDTTPLVLPFESTGWRTVWLDHLDYQCVDYKKAAAFYATLMGWKVRSDDGKQAMLDIGENSGGIIIRGGLTMPPPAAITDAGLGVTRPPVQAVFDGFAWGIDPWDTNKVEAELKKRGLNPVADHHGSDYKSFRVKDPDGFNLAITNGTKANRRKTPANAKLPAPAPFEPTGWNTLYLDHISFEVPDYRRSAAFYQALLGWTGRPGNGQTSVQIGEVAGAIIRGNAAARTAASVAAVDAGRGSHNDSVAAAAGPPPRPANGVTAAIGHISFGIENWDSQRVHDELVKRDVCYTTRDGKREPRVDNTGTLLSWHVPDAMGWDLQIGNKIKPGPGG
jgi:catechol 2,3-dioxygenase-like lactoylglutathione lyase family enzyme